MVVKHSHYFSLKDSLPKVHLPLLRNGAKVLRKSSSFSSDFGNMRIKRLANRHSFLFFWSKGLILRFVVIVNLVGVVCFILFYRKLSAHPVYRVMESDTNLYFSKRLRLKSCNFPKLKPFAPELLPYLSKPSGINCAHSNSIGRVAFVQERGKRILRQRIPVDGNCCYRPFHRENDGESQSEPHCTKMEDLVTEVPKKYDFVELICVGGEDNYQDGFAFVEKIPSVESWLSNVDTANGRDPSTATKDGKRLSVLVLGLDATSHMNFLRAMPHSNKYLLNNLSAIVMNGYTKVAENSLPNIIPMLTGQTLDEFKRMCVSDNVGSEVHLDSCPFIWKRFATNGFRTGFAEDDVGIGIFNMDWGQAFKTAPTDYYLRPFSVLMQQRQQSMDGCYGTRHSFKVLLDNLENTAVALKDVLYFHFTWATKLSHNNFNQLGLGDEMLLKFLKFMDKSGSLNTTVLLLMSDHGSRLDNMRKTSQGKIEDRMPLLYIVLPSWFSQRYPLAYKNIQDNSNRLTSAFDVYETLNIFMDLERLDDPLEQSPIDDMDAIGRRPLSLFDPIPKNRTCFDAGIPLHWCVCRGDHEDRHATDLGNPEITGAVKYAIDSMNFHLKGQPCQTLVVEDVLDAFYIDFDSEPDEPVLPSPTEANKSVESPSSKVTLLRVSFVTSPGQGAFEATLVKLGKDRWLLTEQVVRTNEYGEQSHCVKQEFKEFCYCDY